MKKIHLEHYTQKHIENEVAIACHAWSDSVFKTALRSLQTAEKAKDEFATLFYKEKVKQLKEVCSELDTKISRCASIERLFRRELIEELGIDTAEQCIADIAQKTSALMAED